MKETLLFLNNLLKKDDCIVVGISGGPDSMCLLHVLMSLKEKYNLRIICAHVNHGLRKESEEEKEFVEKYCIENNLVFEYLKINNYKNNKFSEEEGRKKRYSFFDELSKKYNAKYLMTAHHGDDLIESILMRIVRGSNLSGYMGILKTSENDNYKIVRPLLYVAKKDILEYMDRNKIKYVLDKSNDSDKYTRNRYRKHLLPFLKQEEANVHLKFLKYSEELENYNNYINRVIKEKIKDIYVNNRIVINKLLKEDKFLQAKIIEYIIKDIQKTEIFNINDKGLKNILKLLEKNENKEINLSDGFIARRSYNYLYIEKNKNIEVYKIEFKDKLIIFNNYRFEQTEESNIKNNNIIRLNSKEIELPLFIRCKKDGDKIYVKNLFGSKKLKDIFIDSKMDLKKRKEYPILVDANDTIIWVPGIKKSIFDKEINENYDIIIKYMEENKWIIKTID